MNILVKYSVGNKKKRKSKFLSNAPVVKHFSFYSPSTDEVREVSKRKFALLKGKRKSKHLSLTIQERVNYLYSLCSRIFWNSGILLVFNTENLSYTYNKMISILQFFSLTLLEDNYFSLLSANYAIQYSKERNRYPLITCRY